MANQGRKYLKGILLAALVVGLAGAVCGFKGMGPGMGQGMSPGMGCGMGGPGMDRGMHRMMRLSPEQASQVFDLRQKFLDDTAALRKGMLIKSIELAHLWRAENPDEAAIQAKTKELAAVKAQFMEKSISQRLAMRKLVPDFSRMGPGRGPGPQRMGPPPAPGQDPEKKKESSIDPGSDNMAGYTSDFDLSLATNEEPAW
jgi:Spy/CpxP family protein refolding chaperone